MNKPTKPNIVIPESFAANGIKTDFDNEKLTNGFDRLQPDVLAGDNLNKLIDDTYKGLNYGMAAADAINLINEGETLTVVDGKLTSRATGSGLELCDTDIVIRDDKKMFNQLQQMRRSTFDRSKFTVVGSPTITDDGIASGFSTSSYIQTSTINLKNADSWEIITPKAKYEATSTSSQAILWRDTSNGIITSSISPTNKLTSNIYLTTWGGVRISSNIFNATIGNWYQSKIKFTGSSYIFYVKENDGDWILLNTVENSSKMTFNSSIDIGNHRGQNYVFTGSIDLSQFSITVDGKEVFSGNKTGLDVIKPDNYDVVGSPIISADGVASEFSSSNYFNITGLSLNFNDGFTVISESTFGNYSNDMLWGFSYAGNRIALQLYNNRCETYYRYNNSSIITITSGNFSTIETGDKVKIEATFTTAKQVIKVYVNGVQVANGINSQPLTNFNFTSMFLGTAQDTTSFFCHGSIDLNAFKIYVDGNLVYQPCLKIPYTESKTGSKIVDEVYRDRVIDLYEQEGHAGYYTIDEENQNFTLPMGEIYGMIESKKQNSHAIGEPIIRLDNTLYSNEIRLEGALVSKITYADLYKVYGDNYAIATESITDETKFYLPDFRNRAVWGSSGFGYLEAGLPNITGYFDTFGAWYSTDLATSGAFTTSSNQSTSFGLQKGNGIDSRRKNFDASLSNSIYGNSDTVQPPAIKVRVVTRFKDEDYPTLLESGN